MAVVGLAVGKTAPDGLRSLSATFEKSDERLSAPGGRFRRQVLLNTASSGAANVWAMIVALVSLPALLAGLGTEGFGAWALLQTFSATNGWLSLADLGVVVATIRESSGRASEDDLDGVRSIASSSLALSAGMGVIAAGLLAAIGPWLLPALFDTDAALSHELRLGVVILAVGMSVLVPLIAATYAGWMLTLRAKTRPHPGPVR